ncbi:MAG: YfhO family protein [Lachnospiraceae bacterium]|nr:YfhO family protein [Lachnospiraceae bacterium]
MALFRGRKNNIDGKKAVAVIFSFFIPIFIAALAYYNSGIYPGGPNTILIFDLKAQYYPLYTSLRYLGRDDSGFLYSFFGALGSDIISEYSWVIFDPLAWVTVFFSLEDMPKIIYFITLTKIGACGLGFSLFLTFRKNHNKDCFFIVLFSCCYALMSYNIMYSMALPLLGVVASTPLVMLGVEKILDGEKGGVFFVFFLFSLFLCFQMAYIVGIFSVIYFIYCESDRREINIRAFSKMMVFALLAVGVYMPVFLPVMKNIVGARFGESTQEITRLFWFPIWKVFGKFLSGKYDPLDVVSLPSLFCGTLTVVCAVYSMVIERAKRCKIIVALLVFVFYLISFCCVPLDMVWHGFNVPSGFPFRYSYTLCFFILVLANEATPSLKKLVNKSGSISKMIYAVAMLFALVELYLNASTLIASHHLTYRYELNAGYQYSVSKIEDAVNSIDDNDFYRIASGRLSYGPNDGKIFGYNGLNRFSSFYHKEMLDMMGELGYAQTAKTLLGTGGTPLTDSIFGVRYRLAGEKETSYSDIIENDWPYGVYYNEDALSLGYIVDKETITDKLLYDCVGEENLGNALEYQNVLIKELSGLEKSVFEEIPFEIREIEDEKYARHVEIEINNEVGGDIWGFFRLPTHDEKVRYEKKSSNGAHAYAKVNGIEISPVTDYLSTVCVYLGNFHQGERIILEGASESYFSIPWFARFNEAAYDDSIERLKRNELVINEHANGKIKGTVVSEKDDEMLLLTLPYIDGYKIRVDGKTIEYTDYKRSLVLVPIENPGQHNIEISYFPSELLIGIIVSVLSLAISWIMIITPSFRKKEF